MGGKRPILVWLIAIFCIVAGSSQLLSHTAIIAALVPLDERTQAVVASWSLWDKVTPYILSMLLLAAAIALIAMRAIAFHFYATYFAVVSLATIQQAITTKWLEHFGRAAWSAVAGLAIFAFMVWYVYQLRKNGRLQ